MKNVNVTMVSSPDRVPLGKTSEFYLQVNMEAIEPEINNQRKTPINLSLVIDKSGSMQGMKIEQVKLAAENVVRNLGFNDTVSIVVFDSIVQTIVEPTSIRYEKTNLINSIRSICVGNSTNLYAGVTTGINHVNRFYNSNAINRVILFSDGLANVGTIHTENIIYDILNVIGNDKISISTMGVGKDYNEVLLEKIATSTGGNYYYIENANYITTIVSRELTGIQNAIWRNLEIEFVSDSLQIDKIYGYNSRGNMTAIGDIRALDELYVIAKITVPKYVDQGVVKVFLRYDDVINEIAGMEIIKEYKLSFSSKFKKGKEDIQVKTNIELFLLGDYIKEITMCMKTNQFEQAIEMIKNRREVLVELNEKNNTDERIGLKISFLDTMMQNCKQRSYDQKFAKMSSYYSYSAERQNYRKEISKKYGFNKPNIAGGDLQVNTVVREKPVKSSVNKQVRSSKSGSKKSAQKQSKDNFVDFTKFRDRQIKKRKSRMK
ncbi:MAG: VWA domain-containing protein [Candidatus Heimdallarchaeota archaeon]|nr:VWA domain-containing protein [Candidatus Heimdallarchaeota archaeon]